MIFSSICCKFAVYCDWKCKSSQNVQKNGFSEKRWVLFEKKPLSFPKALVSQQVSKACGQLIPPAKYIPVPSTKDCNSTNIQTKHIHVNKLIILFVTFWIKQAIRNVCVPFYNIHTMQESTYPMRVLPATEPDWDGVNTEPTDTPPFSLRSIHITIGCYCHN